MNQQIPPKGIPHVERMNFEGIIEEVAVVQRNLLTQDVYYIRIAHLDAIDRNRLRHILLKRDAGNRELWDVMSEVTLPNGENALKYFHQFVKGRTVTGEFFTPQPGRSGLGRPRTAPAADPAKVDPSKAPKAKKADAPAAE